MNILVIKETSLGDVLHATGMLRVIRENYPDAHLTVLTADTSLDLVRHNPNVDELVSFERYRVKRDWWRHPVWAVRHVAGVMARVRRRRYELALDLQGRLKSVVFLYGARADRKFVKGRWIGLDGFRRRELHAIEEMARVLETAGLAVGRTDMELHTTTVEEERVCRLLTEVGVGAGPFVLVSPFSRWGTKDWSLDGYRRLIAAVPPEIGVLVTGEAGRRAEVDGLCASVTSRPVAGLAGRLGLLDLAELVRRATVVVSGDSFPMHLACAVGTAQIALFGPTDETRIGPGGPAARVLRVAGCDVCYRRRCPRDCLKGLSADEVVDALRTMLRARLPRFGDAETALLSPERS